MTPPSAHHVVAVVAYDSQLKWALGLVAEFRRRGWTATVIAPSDIRTALSDAQTAAYGEVDLQRMPWEDTLAAARSADAVILSIQGPLVQRFTDDLELLRRQAPSADREPVVVAGWVGIIIEKVIAGYLDRCAADVVAVSSADNLRDFDEAAMLLGLPRDNLLLSGLPLLPASPAPVGSGPVRTVVFADQPTVPAGAADRAYVYQRLIEYARAHPDRRVLLRPRHRPDEGTFHVMRHHPETVVMRLPVAPVNFSITYEPITDLLCDADLLLTVSSTAGLEAVGRGVRTAFISDLGIHEKHGNHVLLASGLLATFDDVTADRLPVPREAWIADMFAGDGASRPVERVVDRVEDLVTVPYGERPGAVIAQSSHVRGRIATHEHRRHMPAAAQPAAMRAANNSTVPFSRTAARARAGLRRRARLAAQAVLPRSLYDRLLDARRRRRAQ
ncbi:MAG: hypothetical protein EOO67_06470 [Microbacterium sp.]|nr:MAG: hypothetical protein EOO67_06470 [Microbacterium sp.]